jgi:Zn-dependent protease
VVVTNVFTGGNLLEAVSAFVYRLLYLLPIALISLPIHEFAHGYVSWKFGDPTAKEQGRLTLNPFKHLDPVGFLLLLFVRFGWAKPVPINPMYYKNRRLGMVCVSLAGPLANFLVALLVTVIYGLCAKFMTVTAFADYLFTALSYFIQINAALAIFNLIPIPPLDGSKILMCALPHSVAYRYASIERYGFIIILALSFTSILSRVIEFFMEYILTFFNWIIRLIV